MKNLDFMINCRNCGLCCKHVTLEIDRPTTKSDFEEIKWYLLHENVYVFIDDENDWFIQFNTKCKNLTKKNYCNDHKNRPTICKEYEPETCENNACGEYYKVMYTKPEQIDDVIKKRFNRKKKK